MTLHIHYNTHAICQKLLQEQLDKLDLKFSIISSSEVELTEYISEEKLNELQAALKISNIEIVENHKRVLVQKIKAAIVEMIFMEENLPHKTSSYLADKLKYNYSHLSNIFSSVTYTSIETFIQMQKTERAKQLLSTSELNINEVGNKLNYSSPAHFSTQFKNITGLTPTAFLRIKAKRSAVKINDKLQNPL